MSEKSKFRKKKSNPIVAYFVPFGLRQFCDIAMLASAITIFVGIFVSWNMGNNWVAVIGMIVYALACTVAIIRALSVMFKKDVNKRDPEYKTAVINVCIMGVLLILAIFGIIAAFVWSF